MLGAAPITSLTDGSDTAEACRLFYSRVKNSLIAVYPWTWSIEKFQLVKDAQAPINEWKNAFNLPTDMIGSPIAVFDSSSTGIHPRRYGWELYGERNFNRGQLFTNLDEVWIDYQTSTPEFSLPSYFVRVLRYALAAELAIPITDQISKAEYYRNVTYGSPSENGRGGLLREAMNVDGSARPPEIIEDYTLVNARY